MRLRSAHLRRDARPPIIVHTFHGHVLRGYFDPVRAYGFRLLERWLAKRTTMLIAVSPQVRDDLVELGVAPREKFAVIRLGIELDERITAPPDARAETRRVLGVPQDAFVVGWIGRMTGVKNTDDVLAACGCCTIAASTRISAWSATGPTAIESSGGRTSSASSSAASSSATRKRLAVSTPRSTG